jgi:two-component system, LytTR family, sensor kinase
MLRFLARTSNSEGTTGRSQSENRTPCRDEWHPIARSRARAHSSVMESRAMRTPQIVAFALVIGVFFTAQASLMSLAADRRLDFQNDVVPELVYWSMWALFAPVVLAAARRWPFDVRPWRRPLLAHLLICAALAIAQSTLAFGLRPVLRWLLGSFSASDVAEWLAHKESSIVWGLFMGVMFYAFIVGAYSMLRYRALYAAAQMHAVELGRRGAALEAELARGKLDALRSQLRPHFLFNTLNAISVLSQRDARKTQQMLLRLSSLLRRSLDEESHEVALCDELSFLNEYLDIMRVRFGDRLDISVAIEREVRDARVPAFLLQPLVENAIEHGERDDGRTVISLEVWRSEHNLVVVVENSAANASPVTMNGAPTTTEGIGLGNTRARLRELYGDLASLRLGPASERFPSPGVRVELVLPFASAAAGI